MLEAGEAAPAAGKKAHHFFIFFWRMRKAHRIALSSVIKNEPSATEPAW